MAKVKFEIPKELLNQMKKLEQDTPEMIINGRSGGGDSS